MFGMQTEAWLNQGGQFPPGQRLFWSDSSFALWAYTVSHSQLLLRTRTADERSRIDILFKPVDAMKIRASYNGLAIRCATVEEHDRILSAAGQTGAELKVLILETAGEMDYVVTGAVGWKEDHGQDRDPSALAFFPPGSDPGRILPT